MRLIAARRSYNRYQYETSPRKLEPEYRPKKEPYKSKKASTVKKVQTSTKPKIKVKKQKAKTILLVIFSFTILCTISFRSTQINEKFVYVQKLKENLSEVQKVNEQLEVSIENSLNLNNIEREAKDQLGMKKLDSKQKIYITLPKRDYVEAAVVEVKKEEDENWFTRIINSIMNINK